MNHSAPTSIVLGVVLAMACWTSAQEPADSLAQGFKNPPESAKPRTWWHWTGGNVTKDGITKDLEWMKRVGIGGFQLADVSFGSGQSVEKKVYFGTPEWLDDVRHAAAEADRLGLEMAIFSSPGWSETGGPWVKPEQAMKKLVWSETELQGPRKFGGKLPHPPSDNGPIRNLSRGGARPPSGSTSGPPPDPTFYGDSKVIAYPTPADEISMAELHPKATTAAGAIDATPLLDDDLNSSIAVPASARYVQYEFVQPFRARAFSIAGRGGIPVGRLLASDHGENFRTLVVLPGPQGYRGGTARTYAFPETSARFYRLELSGAPLSPAAVMGNTAPSPAKEYVLSEAVLHSGGRVHRWEDKAGFSLLFEYDSSPTPPVPAAAEIPQSKVIDLTLKMAADGSLDWDVPPGRWTVLRMGYSLTGAKNRPAVPSGQGFEADKLNRKDMEAYFHGYADPIAGSLGPLFGKTLRYFMVDSWEAGMQNWTDDMVEEFRKRRGYDPTPYLPVLAGRIVESAEVSDRFLWDFRRTLEDMFADCHFGTLADMLHQRGMGDYAEAAGVSLETLEDTLLNKSKVDIPMGEFWVHALHPESMYYEDVRGAASAAHVYGKNLAAAESFTGGGYEAPYTLKKLADYWFTQGINRLVFHTSAHQPLDTKPGNTMVGTHLNRNITWAEQAAPFMTYLTRISYMLQQGLFVADLAYLLPEGAPSTMPFWGAGLQPTPPAGYDYDYINTDVLLNRMTVNDDGRLVLPDGMSYRVLVLPETDRMTLPVLRKIHDLVEHGATVLGPKPMKSPSLVGYPDADREVQDLAADLWGDTNGHGRTLHNFGSGRVVWGLPPARILEPGVPPDFESSRSLEATVSWIHRRAGDADIYFIANRSDRAQDLEASFRVQSRAAELWHPDTGIIEPADYRKAADRTVVSLHLEERESVFVVFRGTPRAPAPRRQMANTVIETMSGPWDVSFSPNLSAPATIRLPKLISWTESPEDGVKYFSGTATYSKGFEVYPGWFRPQSRILLDLGVVKDLAEIAVNGKSLGIFWKPPYRVDVTDELRPGTNHLEIRITNEWTNRLTGDRLLPADKRILASSGGMMGIGGRGPQALPESGLIGPVTFVLSQQAASPPAPFVAGIPVNYDEARVGNYTLPDPLVLSNGKRVRTAREWYEKRRPEIVRLFEDNQFGRSPGRPAGMSFDVFDKGTAALDGKATRRQITIYFSTDRNGPKTDLLLYVPAAARKPVPLLLNLSFSANSTTVADPGVRPGEVWGRDRKRIPAGQGFAFGKIDVARLLDHGFGFATLYYGDIDPDFEGGIPYGVRALYLKPGQKEPAPDEWGSIAAWAWGLSRALDYLETDPGVDARRVAIMGVSRLGKTVLWTGASDARFALVVASCSGEGGAALSRRNFGETVAHLTAPSRYPYQFCANYQKFADRVDRMPMDAHMLLALIAPRPVLLQTGDKDLWSDPKGEFLAEVAAQPVFRLLGAGGLAADQWPEPGQPIFDTLGYFMHAGGHGTLPSDWDIFLKFMGTHLRPGR